MHVSLVLTVLGPDRPGLVESLAAAVADHGGNWVESRFARLSGQFAGVLRVDVPADQTDALRSALGGLQSQGLQVHAQSTDAPTGAPDEAGRRLRLELIGHDRPGIVREVSSALAQRRVNVVELHTECTSAPMTGEPLFKAVAELTAPPALHLDDLRTILEQIADELRLDLTLDEAMRSV